MDMITTNQLGGSSKRLSHVNVLFDPKIGAARVPVPDGAIVEYEPLYVGLMRHFVLMVWVDGHFAGCHCGERSGNVIRFECGSDAQRLADVRNALWRATPASNGKLAVQEWREGSE